MKQKSKRREFRSFCLHILGLMLCILPPMICTICYFPLWKESSEKTVAGGVMLLLILCLLPLYKQIVRILSSASSYIMWLILFMIFFFLSKISYEMTVISFFGFIGNLLGAICIHLSKRGGRENAE